ncbi:hypothetical protein ACH5RR_040454 [Cinchona calisaya]|uniref:Uncharacterized protein n=1 Tax=Cinchona calisaya TaxID=153742 RepID=A0ABD2XTX7_9GENT
MRDYLDKLVWHYPRDSQFNVKSAYNLIMDTKDLSKRAVASSSEDSNRVWRALWKMNIPNKDSGGSLEESGFKRKIRKHMQGDVDLWIQDLLLSLDKERMG